MQVSVPYTPVREERRGEMDYTDVALTAHLATPSFSVILKMDY